MSGGSTASFGAGIDLSGVTDPAPQAVYQTERYGTFTYTIPGLNPSGLYTVRLHFAEDYWDSAGQRIFDVAINGTKVLSNFDIFAATGAQDRAIVEQFAAKAEAAEAHDRLHPSPGSPDQNAKSSGIEVIPVLRNGNLLTVVSRRSPPPSRRRPAQRSRQPWRGSSTPARGGWRDYIATTTWGDGTVTTERVQPDPSGSGYDVVDSHRYSTVAATPSGSRSRATTARGPRAGIR